MATSLDSLDEVLTKYQWAKITLWNLYQRGAFILYNVDATRVAIHPFIRSIRFDTIVWNLPHAGFFDKHESDETVIEKHKTLLKFFFSNASILLKDDGEVHVSHQSHGPYEKWEVETLAHLSALKLKKSVPFHPGDYPGYRNRRGVGKFAAKSFALGITKTYKFVHRSKSLSPGETSEAKKLGNKKKDNKKKPTVEGETFPAMTPSRQAKLKKRAEKKLHAQNSQPQVQGGTPASSKIECIATGRGGKSSYAKKLGNKMSNTRGGDKQKNLVKHELSKVRADHYKSENGKLRFLKNQRGALRIRGESDVTLRIHGRDIFAHRHILAARSKAFRKIFETGKPGKWGGQREPGKFGD